MLKKRLLKLLKRTIFIGLSDEFNYINPYCCRLKFEVMSWMERVSCTLTDIGKDLISNVDNVVNHLVGDKLHENDSLNQEELKSSIKFVCKPLNASQIGYLSVNNYLPLDLKLELSSKVTDIAVGAEVYFKILAGEKPFLKRFLQFYASSDDGGAIECGETKILCNASIVTEFSFTIENSTDIS